MWFTSEVFFVVGGRKISYINISVVERSRNHKKKTTSVSKADILKPAENTRKDGRPVHYIIKKRIIISSSLHHFVREIKWGFLEQARVIV